MKYYYLTNSTELKDIHFYPQTKIISGTSVFEEKPNYDKNFYEKGIIEIDKQAIATNLLDRSPIGKGLIVDRKLMNILSEFSLTSHKFHPIPTIHKNENLEYFWLNFVPSTRHIDFEKSEFEIINSPKFNVLGNLKLKSIDFYHRIQNSLTFEENTRIMKLVLKNSFPKNDLISFNKIINRELISEKLKNKLIEEKVTGIEITETDKITMHNTVQN
jgi:hypothetical protein